MLTLIELGVLTAELHNYATSSPSELVELDSH